MKIIVSTALFVLALGTFSTTADAQRRRKPAPKPAPAKAVVDPIVSSAKQKVSNQLHNVNVFVETMGPIALNMERLDREAAAGRLKRDELAVHQANKPKMIDSIRVLRAALVSLESEFRTKTQLMKYLPKLQGISQLAADSEDSAIAGRFVAAKDPLREVGLKLNDTLAVMPGTIAAATASTAPRPVSTVPMRTVSDTRRTSAATASRPAATPATSSRSVTAGSSEPSPGMTPEQVLTTSWGKPTSKRSSKTANGTTEVWTYSGKGTVYIYNGRVTQILR